MAEPYELSTAVTEHSRHITNALDQMKHKLKEHADLLKALPQLQSDVAALEVKKAALLKDIEAAQVALDKVNAFKAKILRELQGA